MKCGLNSPRVLPYPRKAAIRGWHGGFEQTNPEVPEYPAQWYAAFYPPTVQYVTFAHENGLARSGERSVSIWIHPDHPGGMIAYNWLQELSGVSPGHRYQLQGYVRTQGVGKTPVIVIRFLDRNDQFIKIVTTQTRRRNHIVGTTDWTLVTLNFEVPAETARVYLRAALGTRGNKGAKVWFDDIQIVERQ